MSLYAADPEKKYPYSLAETLPFGKYKGATIKMVIDRDYSYIGWCVENIDDFGLDENAWLYFWDIQAKVLSELLW